ncbi:MAG: ADP-ribosylglycohydrolase family protein [Lachnospiraceae bacterium]|nr:ADP-ribosylglycohydrolase family protein [Lachnospiraceae bacterium]
MYGAILGDIIGSPYEFDRGNKSKDFELFSSYSEYTDDTILTIAVGEALLEAGKDAKEEQIFEAVVKNMRKWGRKYPHAGYGMEFKFWLCSEEPKPYNSYGNGAAMRVSAVGWLYDSIERTREVARITAEVTHNHPEGIKGAEAVASAIYLARTKNSKFTIKNYVEREFQYDLERTCDEIRPEYFHQESCQKTVPEAIIAFLEGRNFEDVIRTAVSLGGDCDTLAAIAGSMAEAYYEVPIELKTKCEKYLPEDIKEVLWQFDKFRA